MKEDNLNNIAQRLELPYVPLERETAEERIADALEYIAYRLYKMDAKLEANLNRLTQADKGEGFLLNKPMEPAVPISSESPDQAPRN
jgi:hypothetical protein